MSEDYSDDPFGFAAYSLEAATVASRNGAKSTTTTLAQLISFIANLNLKWTAYLFPQVANLDSMGQEIGRGAQFTVFVDPSLPEYVVKRVNEIVLKNDKALRTLELELLTLCHPPIRNHRNIVKVISWGLDYPRPDKQVPVLILERAKCSLLELLQGHPKQVSLDWTVKHQLCLDVAEGLAVLHENRIVHGDIKSANILIFKNTESKEIPYIAKLSDFGLCIDLESSDALDFGEYGGTAGWVGPEIGLQGKSSQKLEGTFFPELLFRTESFSYGLLVLAVLVTDGESPIVHKTADESYQEMALRLIDPINFPKSLKRKVKALCLSTLDENPQNRPLVSHQLLANESSAYSNWVRDTSTDSVASSALPLGYKKNSTWWTDSLNTDVLQILDQEMHDEDLDKFPGETLFGLAMYQMNKHEPGFKQNFLQYIQAAAKASYKLSQGILGILHHNGLLPPPSEELVDTLQGWLFEAASTGSLVAQELLQKRCPTSSRKAAEIFRRHGGYNNESELYQKHIWCHSITETQQFIQRIGHANFTIDKNNNTPLHIAAVFANTEVITYLIRQAAARPNVKNSRGETPIYKACLAGNRNAVVALISLGADASIPATEHAVTPLHWLFVFDAAEIPHIAAVLVSRGGAQVDACTSEPPHDGPWFHHNTNNAPIFPFHWPPGTPLHWAAFTRSLPALDALLNMGADINARDDLRLGREDCQTALCMTTLRGDPIVLRWLIARGADPMLSDKRGRDCLYMITANSINMAKIFPIWKGFWWWIYHGSYQNHFTALNECVSVLVSAGVNINGNALPSAIEGKLEYAYTVVLLKHGASVGPLINGTPASLLRPNQLYRWAGTDLRVLPYPEAYEAAFRSLLEHIRGTYSQETVYDMVLDQLVGSHITESELQYRLALLSGHGLPSLKTYGRAVLSSLTHGTPGVSISQCTSLLRAFPELEFREAVDCAGGAEEFVFVLCKNLAIDDSDTLKLLQRFMASLDIDSQRNLVQCSCDSSGKRTALTRVILTGKLICLRYFVAIGVAVNYMYDGETALDVALYKGGLVRERYLERLMKSVVYSDRYEFSQDGALLDLQQPTGPYYKPPQFINSSTIYFILPKMITFLRDEAGGKMAVELDSALAANTKDRLGDPPWAKDLALRIDVEILNRGRYSGTGYLTTEENQPHYEQWKILYDLQRQCENVCTDARNAAVWSHVENILGDVTARFLKNRSTKDSKDTNAVGLHKGSSITFENRIVIGDLFLGDMFEQYM